MADTEIRFRVTPHQAELAERISAQLGLDMPALNRRAWLAGMLSIAGERDELLAQPSRPGAIPDDTLRLIHELGRDLRPAAIVAELERRGINTARGGRWTVATVQRMLARPAPIPLVPATELGEHQADDERAKPPEKRTSAATRAARAPAPSNPATMRAPEQREIPELGAEQPVSVHGHPEPSAAAELDPAAEIQAMRERGMSFQAIADDLNKRGIPTAKGGRWHKSATHAIYQRVAPPAEHQAPGRKPKRATDAAGKRRPLKAGRRAG